MCIHFWAHPACVYSGEAYRCDDGAHQLAILIPSAMLLGPTVDVLPKNQPFTQFSPQPLDLLGRVRAQVSTITSVFLVIPRISEDDENTFPPLHVTEDD